MKRTITTAVLTFILTIIAIFILLEWQAQQEQLQADAILEVDSKILEEERSVLVHLPRSYQLNLEQRYPVIYVLDGTSQDINMANTARVLATADIMSEAIVIGILNTDRNRDFTPPTIFQTQERKEKGEADQFLSFIGQELIPFIQQMYRTNGERVLVGNSRGGLFVAYTLMQNPGLFDGYFSFSPAYWRDDHQIVLEARGFLTRRDSVSVFWYNSLGTAENDKMKAGYEAMQEVMKDSVPGLVTQFHWTPDAVHGNNAYYSAPEALRLWADYNRP